MCGNTPSSIPVRKTTGNSRPFALCRVISVTWLDSPSKRSRSVYNARSFKNSARVPPRWRSNSRVTDKNSLRFSIRVRASTVRSASSAVRYPLSSSTCSVRPVTPPSRSRQRANCSPSAPIASRTPALKPLIRSASRRASAHATELSRT